MDKLLNIEPRESLIFTFEPRKPPSCTIRLHNFSGVHVAYKVMTTIKDKYVFEPWIGILLPRSRRDVKVTMRCPEEAPANMECKDKCLIKSVAVSPCDTVETALKLLKQKEPKVEVCSLSVVYVSQTHQNSSDIGQSGAASSPDVSSPQQRSSNITDEQETSGWHFGDQFMKSIRTFLSCLVCWYLIRMMLQVIWHSLWSVTFMITMLVTKMMTKLASDSVEEWIVKIFTSLFVHYLSVVFRRLRSRSDNN